MRQYLLGGENFLRVNTLFTITSIFFIINAPISLLSPATQLSIYGIETGQSENYIMQHAALGSVVIALMAWFAWNLSESQIRQQILLTLMIYFILGFVLSVLGIFTGVMSARGWSLGVICMVFAAWYGYFQLKKPIVS